MIRRHAMRTEDWETGNSKALYIPASVMRARTRASRVDSLLACRRSVHEWSGNFVFVYARTDCAQIGAAVWFIFFNGDARACSFATVCIIAAMLT